MFVLVPARPAKLMVSIMVSAALPMVLEGQVLKDAAIRAAKPGERPYRLSDGGQLYVQVTPAGGKHWRMNYTFGRNASGKPVQKTLSFGSYPAVTLLEARAKREEAKRLLSQGKDPAVERRAAEQANALARQNTFRAAAERWFELQSGWSLEKLRDFADKNDGKWSHTQAEVWTTDPHARWSTVRPVLPERAPRSSADFGKHAPRTAGPGGLLPAPRPPRLSGCLLHLHERAAERGTPGR